MNLTSAANGPSSGRTSTRLPALRRFAVAISLLTVIGHASLGFETSWHQVIAALSTAYALELLFEFAHALSKRTRPAFLVESRSWTRRLGVLIDFLLPAHITALAIAMLLYAGSRIDMFMFSVIAAIASKRLIRLPANLGGRHVMNPSNFGITVTLLLFPTSVGLAPPYQFTEHLDGFGDLALPVIICCGGAFLNWKYTGRLPLVLAWVIGFLVQGVLRSLVVGSSWLACLGPATGVAFLLFTFYMVTDPATSPQRLRPQVIFGFAVAAMYGIITLLHMVYGMFLALTLVCGFRGVILMVAPRRTSSPRTADPVRNARHPVSSQPAI